LNVYLNEKLLQEDAGKCPKTIGFTKNTIILFVFYYDENSEIHEF